MNRCKYVRKVSDGYEYGVFVVSNQGTKKNEERTYVPDGVKVSMEEALSINSMAPTGLPRMGTRIPYQQF